MSRRTTQALIVLFVVLILGMGVYLYVTTDEAMDGPIENVERTGEEPSELQDDEVDYPDYPTADSLPAADPLD